MFRTREAPELTKAQKRLQRVDSGELSLMVENSLYNIGRTLSTYQRSRIPADLVESEIEESAVLLVDMVRELKRRLG